MTVARQLDEAIKLQLRLIEFFDTMLYSADFPEGFRTAAELRGFDFGKSRQPLSDKQQVDRQKLQTQLQCIMSDFGVVDPPSEGCPPRIGAAPHRDKVQEVTEAVMHKLRQRGIA
jgi:4-hydroxy-tetrahydrodipicolinate synthase